VAWPVAGARAVADLVQSQTRSDAKGVGTQNAHVHRHRPLYVLFVHRDLGAIDSCLRELKKGQFTVSSEFVLNPAQCPAQLRSRSYDVIVVEYPSPACPRPHELQLLRKTLRETPLVLLTTGLATAARAELTASGAFEYVEQEHNAQLPMAVRRALNEKKLREELEEVRQALQHSQSLYRALVDNPAYGYRCDPRGNVLDVNQAFVNMLGYASKDHLLSANQLTPIFPDLRHGSPFAQPAPDSKRIDPVETDWKRQDGTTLKARLSGLGVYDDQGNFAGHEIIVVDITEQRTLEEKLRQQASTDSLTELANHRRLFEALHAEICRSKRTGREFSLLLLDLDGLKKINDQFGHLVGNRALCRLGQILRDCCRSIDTAARHGGDEFAVVLPETGVAAATLVARRICELLDADGEAPALSVSLGIASYPREADTIGTLLYAADKALYVMKDQRMKGAQTLSARSGA
jgi:diguanylate cyclase (GGDEF)-like protein/PAS domain S-box-containing protein